LRISSVFLLLATFGTTTAAAQRGVPASAVYSAEGDYLVLVRVNGQPLRLRVDPGMGLMLNPAAAQRLRLKQSMIRPSVRIGSVELKGNSKVARLEVGSWRGSRRFYWFDRDIVTGADGTIGMADLPNDTVTLQLRPVQPGETKFTFPVEESTTLGLTYDYALGETRITTRFSPALPVSHASAAAGALMAAAHGGAWVGELEQQPVMFGVMRPVRPMRFSNPISLNGFSLDHLLIRTSDYRGGHLLPADQPAPNADPSEIVVTGARGGGRAAYRLTFGQDRLSACSSITYIKAARQLALSCRLG